MDKQTSARVLEFVERALVPLLLGFLVFTTQQAQVRVARSQAALAEQQAQMSAAQAAQNYSLECTKFFLNDIFGDSRRQRMAIAMLQMMNESLVVLLSKIIAEDTAYSPALRADAESVRAGIQTRRLTGFKVVIYYLEGDSIYAKDALVYRDAVKALPAESVEVRPVSGVFFKQHDYSDGYQIRYEADIETNAAEALKAILEAVHPGTPILLKTIVVGLPVRSPCSSQAGQASKPRAARQGNRELPV